MRARDLARPRVARGAGRDPRIRYRALLTRGRARAASFAACTRPERARPLSADPRVPSLQEQSRTLERSHAERGERAARRRR